MTMYDSIIVGYTRKYHKFVAVVLLRVRSRRNNVKGNTWYVSAIALYCGDTDFIIKLFIARFSANECS